ncbi:MAG: 2-C-methyl-D-erythritol 4-phosphate cytidylyltransferase [Proteobacteria bacterium]|nr:2-C-methyl-D-erythritol 4-phosphate cytidylyltransferase [Pseudomonadota bacterium]
MSADCIALIVAGGSGKRFDESGSYKQFAPLCQHTVLWHAQQPFSNCKEISNTRIVVAKECVEIAHQALAEQATQVEIVARGGATRAESVYNGLADCADDTWILVHDAARPCLSTAALQRLLTYRTQEEGSRGDGAVLALPLNDALKRAQEQRIEAVIERAGLWTMQTPQLFRAGTLKKLLPQYLDAADEAEAVWRGGGTVDIIAGDRYNIKITYTEDLQIAELLLQNRAAQEQMIR